MSVDGEEETGRIERRVSINVEGNGAWFACEISEYVGEKDENGE